MSAAAVGFDAVGGDCASDSAGTGVDDGRNVADGSAGSAAGNVER